MEKDLYLLGGAGIPSKKYNLNSRVNDLLIAILNSVSEPKVPINEKLLCNSTGMHMLGVLTRLINFIPKCVFGLGHYSSALQQCLMMSGIVCLMWSNFYASVPCT